MLSTAWSRFLELFTRGRRERRLSDEVEAHLDLLTEEQVARGLSRDEARLAARKSFGGIDRTRILHREQRGWPVIESLMQDVRFAMRVLWRDRGFAATAILVLGVGLGVNNLFFTLVYAHKYRGVPVKDVDRVVFISTIDDRGIDRPLSLPEFEDLKRSQTSFSAVAAAYITPATIGDDGRAPDRVEAAYITANALPLMGVAASTGRLPGGEDDRPGGARVVLLGSDLWRLRYGSDPQMLGRTVLIDGAPATVIGIVPGRSGFPSGASLWLPIGQMPDFTSDHMRRNLRVYGRLRDDVTIDAATAEVDTLFGSFETAHPDSNRNVRARVMTLNHRLLGDLTGWMQFIVAGVIVILVACANAANLMMARALHRAPEIAIRTSLGASRARIAAQLLIEAAMLAGAGAVIGTIISLTGVRIIQNGIPAGALPYWFDYTMNGDLLAALVTIAMATVMIFGLVPALQASRIDVNGTLKDGGRHTATSRGMRAWTAAFLTAELALAMILLNSVVLTSYISNRPIPTDAHINTTQVITAAITLPSAAYASPERRAAFFARLDERLQGRAQVVTTSRASILPGEGGPLRRLRVQGQEQSQEGTPAMVLVIDVAPRYFETIAVALLRGRDFTGSDGTSGRETAIVNERFATVFLDGRDPVGMQISVTPTSTPLSTSLRWLTIVGMAPAIRQQSVAGLDQRSPLVYVPIGSPPTATLMVRHRVDPEAAADLLRADAHSIDSNVALYRVRTLQQAVRDGQWGRHTSAVLADTVTWMSVLLALVGLYAVAAQRVTLKTKEIGLRMALGARRIEVAVVVIKGLRLPLLLGILLATLGAMAWDGSISSGVAGVYASAPSMLAKSAAWIVVCVLLACLLPLRRATRIDPVSALRHE